jgi:hypothetical protein
MKTLLLAIAIALAAPFSRAETPSISETLREIGLEEDMIATYVGMLQTIGLSEADLSKFAAAMNGASSAEELAEAFIALMRRAGMAESMLEMMRQMYVESFAELEFRGSKAPQAVAAASNPAPAAAPVAAPPVAAVAPSSASAAQPAAEDPAAAAEQPKEGEPADGVVQFSIDEQTHYGIANLPAELIGTYLYEAKGEPIVVINRNAPGKFQPHGRPPITIKTWLETNAAGEPLKRVGPTGNYQVILVVQYLDGNDGNYPVGSYDRMSAVVDLGEQRAIILGERIKPLSR